MDQIMLTRYIGTALAVSFLCSTSAAQDTSWMQVELRILGNYYEVYDVASNDVLNIRERPSGSSLIVDTIAFNAQVVEVFDRDATGKWGRVHGSDIMGWVSMRYLRSVSVPTYGGTDIPIGLGCFGEEPFWKFKFRPKQLDYYELGKYLDSYDIITMRPELVDAELDYSIYSKVQGYRVYFDNKGNKDSLLVARNGRDSRSSMADIDYLWSVKYGERYSGAVGCSFNK